MEQELAQLLLNKLLSIRNSPNSNAEKLEGAYKILKYAIDELIKKEGIHFSTLFSRIAYLGNKLLLSKSQLYFLHAFRKSMEEFSYKKTDNSNVVDSYIVAISSLIVKSGELEYPDDWSTILAADYTIPSKFTVKKFIGEAEVLALSIDQDNELIKGYTTVTPHEQVTIRFNVPHKNEIFSNGIMAILRMDALPINMNLHAIEIDEEGVYIPNSIILEPSFLIDVTTVAEAFKQDGSLTRLSLLRKFLPSTQSLPLLLGNISNHMLDELFANPTLEFSEIKKQLFHLHPLVFALYEDAKVVDLLRDLKVHYTNLKNVITTDFKDKNIKHENSYLEPAFYSPSYGLQGRLDLLQVDDKKTKATIVELKSGKAFRPNIYGLSEKHYVQTLLYDLLVKSAFNQKTRVDNYILYSKESEESLRYAPTVKTKQKEALRIRNEIIVYNKSLERIHSAKQINILDFLKVDKFKKISGFEKNDVEHFEKVYSQLTAIEKSYFNHFTAFITREQSLSKIGKQEVDFVNGLAGIWQNTIEEKKSNYNVLNDLEIVTNVTDEIIPQLVFRKSALTMELSNFRVGDIGVLYPELSIPQSALHTQVFKCTILNIGIDTVTVRLRSKQKNYSLFREYKYWHIDHDVLDSGYTKMTKSLFEFGSAVPAKKDLWLTLRPPAKTGVSNYELYDEMTVEQKQILAEILDSEDYYLLWGPPGTGKTSVMVKYLIQYLFEHTEENILLLAYTNRAVDELCEALVSISKKYKEHFIRIGSRYAIDPSYLDNLLFNKIENVSSRKELKEILQCHRIYVGTVSSMLGKSELFQLLNFDRVIIDEASQLLEPTIIGFLTRFRKVVLIGDHKQLPAVVQQNSNECLVNDAQLKAIGLDNLSNSLFERLYKRCLNNKWDWAIGQLNQQGRMHEDLMAFPNKHFYNSELTTIDKVKRLTQKLESKFSDKTEAIANERIFFINSEVDESSLNIKTNEDEAKKIVKLLKVIKLHCIENQLSYVDVSIGVITAFRAQIANIKATLEHEEILTDNIFIDTVERFQGGAKDIIIISFCMNHVSQMNRMVSLSSDGTDRKLNVALTRAKEQLFLIGNERVLSINELYRSLIEAAKVVNLV